MYFIRFDGTPRRDAQIAPETAGGAVVCWIECATLAEAVRVAREAIEAQGWIIGEPDEAHEVDEDWYPAGHKARQYFEQALIDKEVFVFFTFPEVDEESGGE